MRLIYQVAVGEVPEFYRPCMLSVHEYAIRIGAHYVIQHEPELKIVPKASQRSENALRLGYLPIFEKEGAFAYLGEYESVCIIDADVFVMPGAPDIFAKLGGADFAGVPERDLPLLPKYQRKVVNYSRDMFRPLGDVDWKWDLRGAEFYNMGVMMLSGTVTRFLKGQTPKQFIERPEFERFVNGEGKFKWSTDQVLLNWWVKREGMKTVNLDWRWNCIHGYVEPAALKQGPHFVHFNLASLMPHGGAEIPEIIRSLQ